MTFEQTLRAFFKKHDPGREYLAPRIAKQFMRDKQVVMDHLNARYANGPVEYKGRNSRKKIEAAVNHELDEATVDHAFDETTDHAEGAASAEAIDQSVDALAEANEGEVVDNLEQAEVTPVDEISPDAAIEDFPDSPNSDLTEEVVDVNDNMLDQAADDANVQIDDATEDMPVEINETIDAGDDVVGEEAPKKKKGLFKKKNK